MNTSSATGAGAGAALGDDYDHLARQLARRGIDIAAMQARAAEFTVAVPSWGVATGGTRFARFPGPGEPRSVFEKLDDCAGDSTASSASPRRSRCTFRGTSPRIPRALRAYAADARRCPSDR